MRPEGSGQHSCRKDGAGPPPSPTLRLGSLGLALPPGVSDSSRGRNHLLEQRSPFSPSNTLLQASLERSRRLRGAASLDSYSSSHFGNRAPPRGADGSLAPGLRLPVMLEKLRNGTEVGSLQRKCRHYECVISSSRTPGGWREGTSLAWAGTLPP